MAAAPRVVVVLALSGGAGTALANDISTCDSWGRYVAGEERCPSNDLAGRRVAYGISLGGGQAKTDGRHMSYFLWGGDVRVGVTPWLAFGVGDLSVRVGHDDAG